MLYKHNRNHTATHKHESNPGRLTFMCFFISSIVAAKLLYAASWTFLALIPRRGRLLYKSIWSIGGCCDTEILLTRKFCWAAKAKNRLALIRVQCSLVAIAISSPYAITAIEDC